MPKAKSDGRGTVEPVSERLDSDVIEGYE